MQSKADFLKSKFGGLALEPHVIVIGSLTTGDAISQLPGFAVLWPKVYFQVASIPQAVDVILKAAFVFDIKYLCCQEFLNVYSESHFCHLY